MVSTRTRSVIAGVLVANSAPHLASAAAGHEHLTPLAGRRSGPGVNALWAVANLVGGLALLRRGRSPGTTRWGVELRSFEAGYLAFAAWMALSERLMPVNSPGRQRLSSRRTPPS